MPKRALSQTLRLYREAVRRSSQDGLSMRLRLFAFLILFLNAIMLGVLLILFSFGVFQGDLSEHKAILSGELNHIAQDSYQFFGAVSVQSVDLAKSLSVSIENNLQERGGSAARLQENPQLLEHLLEEEMGRLTGALERSRGSGVFLLLDATVNPDLEGAEDSRACIYLKNMEPNIVSGMEANMRYEFGPMSLARKNNISILPQWQMEMNIGEMPCFTKVMETAKEQERPISRLYRWSGAVILPGGSERVMLCAVPLIASDGTVLGVCGFEISEMLFKLSYAPGREKYDGLLCLLSPVENGILKLSDALFAGTFPAGPAAPERTQMEISTDADTFNSYRQPRKESYAGMQQAVSLYPTDSAFRGEQWAVILLMPQHELEELISAKNHGLILGLLAFMLASIGIAALISRRYIHPVVTALEQLKNPNPSSKTRIPEIDDLIEFLAAQDEASSSEKKEASPQEQPAFYSEFAKNIRTLSAAEKSVFDLYVQGYTAKEIAEILCLSINTIKTHNRRIYMKLNVTSRKELMVYIQMMEAVDSTNGKNQ